VAECDVDQLPGLDCQQYSRHILRNHASLDGSSPLSSLSNFLCQRSLPRQLIPTTPQRQSQFRVITCGFLRSSPVPISTVLGAYGSKPPRQTTGSLGSIRRLQRTPGTQVSLLQPGSAVTERCVESFPELSCFCLLTGESSGEPTLPSLHIVYRLRVPPSLSRSPFW